MLSPQDVLRLGQRLVDEVKEGTSLAIQNGWCFIWFDQCYRNRTSVLGCSVVCCVYFLLSILRLFL